MKRIETIKEKDIFNNIIRTGKFKKNDNFVIYYKEKKCIYSKYGIAIKNSIGKAYIRNKLKRQARSLIDLHKKEFKNEYDYIIMIREGCLKSKYDLLSNSFKHLLGRINNEK
jgi:ribonuclease P protein component